VSKILLIAGPSGAGKTTVARQLSSDFQTYIETFEDNPYLHKLLLGAPDFDAEANQRWFLQRVENFIKSATSEEHLVVDQSPSAIVYVYAQMFRDNGLIDDEEYHSLAGSLDRIEYMMKQWESGQHALFLDAPTAVLRRRISWARGEASTPPLRWFADVRRRFVQLQAWVPKATIVPTADCGVVKSTQQARKLLLSA
jgi:deoxyadenosine/deoxycytidine kinase